MQNVKTIIRQWWPTALTAAVILYATLDADPVGADSLPLIPHIDKLIHAIMFGGLFSAIAFDYRRAGHALGMRTLLLFALIAAIAGGADELAQSAVHNGREGDIVDFAADCTGIAVAFFAAPPVINHIFRKN